MRKESGFMQDAKNLQKDWQNIGNDIHHAENIVKKAPTTGKTDTEKYDAFCYDFSSKEFRYFLFGKKICPKCGGRLQKQKCHELKRGSDFNSRSVDTFVPQAKVKHYFYVYICEKCGAEYSLTELAENKRK